jgi:hypothetical protein
MTILLFQFCTSPEIKINNPYQSINWENAEQHKANFHTHTVRSDGILNPQVVADEYHAMGYSILAITDHNEVTYPWTAFSSMEPLGFFQRQYAWRKCPGSQLECFSFVRTLK